MTTPKPTREQLDAFARNPDAWAQAEREKQRQREIATHCDLLRRWFEAGRSFALFECIDWCARVGLPPPAWAADAFHDGVLRVRGGMRSLDQAFGKPHKKGEHLGKDTDGLMWAVWWHVEDERADRKDSKTPLDATYFAGLAKRRLFLHTTGKRRDTPLSGRTLRRLYELAAREDLKAARDRLPD